MSSLTRTSLLATAKLIQDLTHKYVKFDQDMPTSYSKAIYKTWLLEHTFGQNILTQTWETMSLKFSLLTQQNGRAVEYGLCVEVLSTAFRFLGEGVRYKKSDPNFCIG